MNRLANETSPYLLQHKNNPVDWYAWGDDALAKAKAENKPIFLSIGYSACHWCHVMEHESFEDPSLAQVMNELYVNIKVDREERPDLDSIYMQAVVALTGGGGWPMSVWLTPEGVPFYGGTYFPPDARGGMPSFLQVLKGVHDAWVNRREQVMEGAQSILTYIQQAERLGLPINENELTRDTLKDATQTLWKVFDWRHHGWGSAPKFPQPMAIEYLLRYHVLTGESTPLDMATKALTAMMRGGIYDQLGGGFHRYATDANWLVPHFEKMLYDNAQLVRVYLHAYQLTGREDFKHVVEETLAYLQREMTDASGAFYSTQDADSEGEEGKYFVWSIAEIDATIGPDAGMFKDVYGVRPGGNFEGHSILFRALDDDALIKKHGDDAPTRLAAAKEKLFTLRWTRVKPALDDKVLSAWNGMMLAAVAEAYQVLKRPEYLELARRNADFLLSQMLHPVTTRLQRSWRNGITKGNGYLEDYANVIDGLLATYEATFDERYFTTARALADAMLTHFKDTQGGFFDTSDDHETLVTRPKDIQDNATPSGNAMACTVLLKLTLYTGDYRYAEAAAEAMRAVQPTLAQHPTGFAQWLIAQTFALGDAKEIAFVGDVESADTRALLDVVFTPYRPFKVVALKPAAANSAIPLLADRVAINQQATAYVCQNFTCQLPTTNPAVLQQQLSTTP